jgi:phosphate-selective porin OprO/OprP
MRAFVAAALVFTVIVVSPAHAQQQPTHSESSGLFWRDRPSIQLGPARLDIRLQLARDWRHFDPAIDEEEGIWRMRRGGINGEIGNDLSFEIERDFFRGGEWRDVFVRWQTHRQIEISAGRYKMPFGREQNVSTSRLDFASRTLASNLIAPGRDKGVMASGSFFSRGLTYDVGVFADDGDNGQPRVQSVGGVQMDVGPSFVGRVTAVPLRTTGNVLDTFRVGFAYSGASLPAGPNSLSGESLYGTALFFAPVDVNGKRTRAGVELSYLPGPASITAEWMQAREQRNDQAPGGAHLPALVTTGWYAAVTWLVTGENKEDFERPRRPLFAGGIGAVEIAARYEHLGFESAANIRGNRNRVWTLGVNWFANRWVRATVNAVREDIADSARTPQPGTSVFWSSITRLQLAF